jgi:outer membrane biosynthesis protein TonB
VYLVKASPNTSGCLKQRKVQMQKNKIYRSFLAIGAIAVLWSAPVALRAAELHPLVVIGIPLDKVATVHPTPEYPRSALALGVDGKVRIKMTVQDGRIVEAAALSGSPMLAYSAKTWIVGNWKFKPEISGVFTIPINYKRQA